MNSILLGCLLDISYSHESFIASFDTLLSKIFVYFFSWKLSAFYLFLQLIIFSFLFWYFICLHQNLLRVYMFFFVCAWYAFPVRRDSVIYLITESFQIFNGLRFFYDERIDVVINKNSCDKKNEKMINLFWRIQNVKQSNSCQWDLISVLSFNFSSRIRRSETNLSRR